MDADLIARLAKAWHGRTLEPDDAAGLAAALAPIEAAMQVAEKRLGFTDMTPHFADTLAELARD